MKKYIIPVLFFFLLGCATAGPKKSASGPAGDDQDFAALITQVILKNAGKLPNKRVAVIDFTDIKGEESAKGRLLAEQVTSKLAQSGTIIVIEREKLDKVLKEQQLSESGITENQDEEAGKVLNVDAVVSGSLAQNGDNEEVNARMIDVKSGEIYCAADGKRPVVLSQKELENLSQEQKAQITQELNKRQNLKAKNPRLYAAIESMNVELGLLKQSRPVVFQNTQKFLGFMQRAKNKQPRVYLAITAPENGPILEQFRKNRPAVYQNVLIWRKSLASVLGNVPSYREIIDVNRKVVIEELKKK